MPPALTLPADEADRLALFKALASLDVGRHPTFERVARLARDLCDADEAGVTLINPFPAWSKVLGSAGGDLTLRTPALCGEALIRPDVTWIEDARDHPRFALDDGVRSGCVAGFAAAPLICPPGLAVGVLSVAWRGARPRDPATVARLETLAELAADALAQRRARTEVETEVSRTIVRLAPASVAVLDREFRFLMVSERMEADWGLPETELFGRCIFDAFAFLAEVEPLVRRARDGETFSGKRIGITLSDGSVATYDWDIAPWYNPDGEIGGVRMMTFDVTELVNSQEIAARSEDRLKLALDVADTVVWEMDFRTGKISSAGAIERLFEDRVDHANLLQELSRFVHPGDRERVDAAWWATVGQGLPLELEYRLARESGEDFWVMSNAQVFTDADGKPARVIGVLRDITERKQRDLAVEAAREAAEAANRAKSEFLANMSHEIRTPLNGVLGVAGALSRTELGESQRDMVGLIETSAHNLNRLLSDVLDLARIESGRLAVLSEPIDLKALIGSTAALFAKDIQAKGVGFRYHEDAGLSARHMGDPVRLRQILSNLLSNAVKFTLRGEISLRVRAAAPQRGRQMIAVSVADTGVGFNSDAHDRLFERFEQADGSITRRFGGTGLGLPISRALAEGMGGRLEARSKLGQGSCFTLTVELECADGACAPSPAGRPDTGCKTDPGSPLRVLLAEDHPINRKVAELILTSANVHLTMVENGEQAVAAFDAEPFELVLMDMQMPVMDGLTAIRTIRAREAASGLGRTPIHVLTANAMPEHIEASHAAGADGHLTKPIAAGALLGLVTQVRAAGAAEPEALRLSA